MKASLILIAALLSGCAGTFGHSSYVLSSKPGADGKPIYELSLKDGKEFEGRQVQFQTINGGASLTIMEGESKAFKGQALGVKALNVFPTTGLSDILK